MKSNYDRIAPFYDFLARLIFRNAIVQAHLFMVSAIPANSRVLIAGGGTGYILDAISAKHPNGLHITYVEVSEKMTAFSKKRNYGNNQVEFLEESICDSIFTGLFDVVITPFLFDNFTLSTVKSVFGRIDNCLRADGLWMIADFQLNEKNKWWQKLMLKSMYLFFRICCHIEARELYDMKPLFKNEKYKIVAEKTFYKKFIYASVYEKNEKGSNI